MVENIEKDIEIDSDKKNNKVKKRIKLIVLFVLYEFIFMAITGPLLLIYGPFNNLSRTILRTAMGTRHSYLVTDFVPKSRLDKILNRSQNAISEGVDSKQNVDGVKVEYANSQEIKAYDIHTPMYDGYLLEIKDPFRVKIGLTSKLGVAGEKTSEIAKKNGAIAAINGGAFSDKSPSGRKFAGTGALPGGFVISNSKVVYTDVGEDTEENVTAFDDKGRLVVGNHTLAEMRKMNVREAICFKPPTLIINGKKQITDKQEDGFNPRTAIGQKKDGTVLMLVVDGRKSLTKLGASLYDLQEILYNRGAINASNLDGGYSTAMYYKGELINSPNEWDGERSVATILYVQP